MGHCFRLVVIPINMKLCPCIIPINIFQLVNSNKQPQTIKLVNICLCI